MRIRRETLRIAIGAFVALAALTVVVLTFKGMASKTDKIDPTEALMAETSFTQPAATQSSDEAAEEQAEGREARTEACRDDVEEIGKAVDEANEEGKVATSVMDLEVQGYLDEVPKLAPVLLYTLEMDQGRPTGTVLINGVPGPLACDS